MNKKLIRLTESDLRRIVKKSVNRLLKEGKWDGDDDPYLLSKDDDGDYDDPLFSRVNEVNNMLSIIRNFIEELANVNPRVRKRADELIEELKDISITLDPQGQFIHACLLQGDNPWGATRNGEKVFNGKDHKPTSYWSNQHLHNARTKSLYPEKYFNDEEDY